MGIGLCRCQQTNCQNEQNIENEIQTSKVQDTREQSITISSNEQQPDAIQIYFSCLRVPQYQILFIQRPFVHGVCSEKVWLYPDGCIKCEGLCPPFGIWEAYFICLTNTVSKYNFSQNNENIKTLLEFSKVAQITQIQAKNSNQDFKNMFLILNIFKN